MRPNTHYDDLYAARIISQLEDEPTQPMARRVDPGAVQPLAWAICLVGHMALGKCLG